MAKYRIKVEALDPAEELRAEYRVGMECDGFTVLCDTEDGGDISVHEMSTMDIAWAIFKHDVLMEAALIADGLRRSRDYKRAQKQITGAVKISPDDLRKLFGGGKA